MTLLRLAWWLVRGQRGRAALVIGCIALGVCARVGIGTFQGQFERALAREARQLLGADLEIGANRALTDGERAAALAVLPDGSRVQLQISLTTMAMVGDAARPVDLRVIDPAYPPAGSAIATGAGVDPARPFARLAEAEPLAYVQPELLILTDARVGDRIRLGRIEATIAGTVGETAGLGSGFFAAGPKVLISHATFAAAELSGAGARIRHALLIALADPTGAADIARRVEGALAAGPDERAPRVRTSTQAQDQAAQVFDRFADFLRLLALMAVMLSAIGVAAVARGFVHEQLESVAVLQVLGATARRVAGLYILIALSVGFIGGVIGAALGAGAQAAVAAIAGHALRDVLPTRLEVAIDPSACAWGVALGTLVAGWAAAMPVLALSGVRPLPVLRGQAPALPRSPASLAMAALGVVALVLLSRIETRSWVVGPVFVGGTVVAGAALALVAWIALPLVARSGRFARGAVGLRHGLANLARREGRAWPAVVAIGLASALALWIAVHGESIRAELDPPGERLLPSLFCIDIQDDQIADWRATLEREAIADYVVAPMVAAKWRHRPPGTSTSTREGERTRFFREREQRLSWRDALSPDETIVAGAWMPIVVDPAAPIEISLERRFAERTGLALGDRMVFDIQGVEIAGTVTSLRAVRFTSFRPNFFILVSPHALADAPRTWISSIPDLPDGRKARLQAELARAFPTVTSIDVAYIGRKVRSLVDRVGLATRVLAAFSLAAGLVVLVGVAMATARARLRDAALLATLGATRGTLALSLIAEFGAIGLIAALVGGALAVGLSSWAFAYFFGLPATIPWPQLAVVVAGIAVACALTGVLACRKVFTVRPLAVLREE